MLDQRTISPVFGDTRLPPRFWAKVRIGSVPVYQPDLGPCWEWTAARDRNGYGIFQAGSRADGSNRTVRAHRLAYEMLIRPIPTGLEPDHLCRTPACIKPLHIEPVTHAENNRRGDLWQRRRRHCPRGHPYDEGNTYLNQGRRVCRACWKRPRLELKRKEGASE